MKMKNLFKTLLLSAVVLTAGTLASCKDDDTNEGRYEGIPTISVSPTDLAVTLTGGTTEAVTITTEAEWTISIPSDASDITASKTSGFGNGSVTFTVPAHAERNVTVTVTATGYYNNSPLTKTATINIAQNEGGESLEGTIASITKTGTYTINDAVVVGTYDSGFVMTDRSKLYFLVYMFDKNMNPDPQVPAVGTVVNVSGDVVDHNGMLQFNYTTTVTPTGETQQVDLGEPAAYGYEEMKAYKSNPSYVYVKYTGTLSVSNNYYNILFAEGTDTQGSISYPNPELNVASYNGKVVDVTGFLVGASGSSFVNTCCTAISENSDVVTLSVDPTSLAFDAVGGTKDINITTQNADGFSINTTFSGNDASSFSASVEGNVVKVTATENAGAARSATLKIAIMDGATEKASVEVPISQAEAGAMSITMDFAAQGYENAQDVTSLTVAPITATFSGGTNTNYPPKYYDSGSAIRLYGGNTVTFAGATITKIELSFADGYDDESSNGSKNPITADSGTYASGVWSGNAESVTLTVGGTSGQRRITKVIVTYAE